MKNIILIFFTVFLVGINITYANNKYEQFDYVIEKMKAAGIDSNFISKIIEYPDTEFHERFVKINVTGYLGKGPDYSKHYNQRAVNKSKAFLNENMPVLQLAELKFGVPKEVLTSILWIETRHGAYLGKSHVVSVYLSTAMADKPEHFEKNVEVLKGKVGAKGKEYKKLYKKLIARTDKKTNWAMENLIALSKLDTISPIPILELRGSWAGAFGIPQFLPNSYINWAVDGNGDDSINLFELEDAVFSCANYLKTNGWGETKEEQKAAVFHYNNSNAYVNAVLKLADLITVEEEETQPLKGEVESSDKNNMND